MNKQKRDRIASIVETHKDYMTMKDMSEEFGISYRQIYDYCVAKEIKLLTYAEINTNYIRHMAAHKTKEQMATIIGVTVGYIHELAKREGITLMATPRRYMDEDTGIMINALLSIEEPKKVERIKETYTQTGSPYGIADEITSR